MAGATGPNTNPSVTGQKSATVIGPIASTVAGHARLNTGPMRDSHQHSQHASIARTLLPRPGPWRGALVSKLWKKTMLPSAMHRPKKLQW